MNIRFYNARVLTMVDGQELFTGEVWVSDNKIAYVGDAIYELRIREYILSTGYQDVNKLHKYAVKFTSGENQAKIIDYLIKENLITEEEISYFKRGRNSGHSKNRRSISVISYKKATGFEAMIGYLYLENKK